MPDLPRPDPARGVFETVLVIDSAPIELAAHLGRLRESTGVLYDCDPPADLEALVRERAASLPLGRLRLLIAPADGGGLGVEIVTAAVDPRDVFPSWERAIGLRSFVVKATLGAHKWADRSGLAELEADAPNGSLAMLVDSSGAVLEASRANVFAVEDDVLLTPPADGRILAGIARARAIQAAHALGAPVREATLPLERLVAAGEAFLTGSVRGLEPVSRVDRATLKPPGKLVFELAAKMRQGWFVEDAARA